MSAGGSMTDGFYGQAEFDLIYGIVLSGFLLGLNSIKMIPQ